MVLVPAALFYLALAVFALFAVIFAVALYFALRILANIARLSDIARSEGERFEHGIERVRDAFTGVIGL